MLKNIFRGILTVLLLLVIQSSTAQAMSSVMQQTLTPTPTLPPPPEGGGLVSVHVLVVRSGTSTEWPKIGGIPYGTEVFPVGRSVNGTWINIIWNDEPGWIAADLVEWHPDLDLQALPIIIPQATATPTPAPSNTLSASPTSTPTTVDETVETPTLEPTVEYTPTVRPTLTPSPLPSPTSSSTPASAVIPAAPTPSPPPNDNRGEPQPRIYFRWPLLAGGGALIFLVTYLFLWMRGRRERLRYTGGFVLDMCPVCQIGYLQLSRTIQYPLGIPTVKRTIRCNTCRSVLRQMRPGQWRYTIDPYVNPELAADHDDAHPISDDELQDFAVHARRYTPRPDLAPDPTNAVDEAPSDEFQSALEHLSTLEAEVIAAQQQAEQEDLDDAESETDHVEEETADSLESSEANNIDEEEDTLNGGD